MVQVMKDKSLTIQETFKNLLIVFTRQDVLGLFFSVAVSSRKELAELFLWDVEATKEEGKL